MDLLQSAGTDLEEIPLIYSFNDRSKLWKLLHGLKKLLESCSSIAASNQFVMAGIQHLG